MALKERIQSAWNAFMGRDPTHYRPSDIGVSYGYRPDRHRFSLGNERSIVTSVYNRLAIDAASITIQHVTLDEENDRFKEVIYDGLNNCLTLDANIDQTGRAFIQDVVMSMFDEGHVVIVPVDTDVNVDQNDSFEILTLRTGRVVEWYPKYVKVDLWNENSGRREQIIMSKQEVAIIENPWFAIMNEPNSTAKRLIRKMNLLDVIDEQQGAGKLDLIVQLPYVVRNETTRRRAEEHRKDIENQLANSQYGIAYVDSAEHITQLNRSVDNQLVNQIEYLTSMLFSQLGLTTEIMNGTATPEVMTNYYNRTIEPIISAIVDEMKRKFLSKDARKNRESICFFRDPFKLVPVIEIASIADSFTRNEIMTSNEIRQLISMKPSTDPKADELRNKNLNISDEEKKSEQGVYDAKNDQNEEEKKDA